MRTTGLNLVAARMFGPSPELVKRYADLVRSEEEVWPEIRELLSDYIEREMAPTEDGHVHRVLMLLFEGENAVSKLRDAIGGFEDSIESADTVRGTFGDYIKDNDGKVTYFEPAVLTAPTVEIAKQTIGLWSEFSDEDGGILDNTIRLANEEGAEQALVIIKPDNFTFPSSRPGNIIDIFSRTGLRLIGTKVQQMSLAQAQEFYGPVQNVLREKLGGRAVDKACEVLKEEFDFEMPAEVREALEGTLGPAYGDNQFFSIMQYMSGLWAPDVDSADVEEEGSARSMVLIYAGDNAIEKIRSILGPTDPSKAEPGSVRKEYGTDIMVNAAHASDSPENAQREIGILKVADDTINRWYSEYYS